VGRLLRLRVKERLDTEGISGNMPKQVIAVSDSSARRSS
jgi:hypothetical protein